MPLAIVTYKRRTDRKLIKGLARSVRMMTAEALNTDSESGRLTTGDVEVEFKKRGRYDTDRRNLSILIFAHDVPERRANLADRQKTLQKTLMDIHPQLSHMDFSVWILLALGAFGERISPDDGW